MDLQHFKSSSSVSSVANSGQQQQQQFPMKMESSDHDHSSMLLLNNNNNNHVPLHVLQPTTSSNYMSDLYMVKRHYNEIVTEHHNLNHNQHIPQHHQTVNNSGKSLNDEMRIVKRTHDRFQPGSHHVPTAVRRNERERNRVKMVNQGFSTLRQHVPNGAKNKKMSKVETLRSAVDYIKELQKILGEGSLDVSSTTSSSLLDECYNTSGNCSGMEGNSSCSPMSNSCSPRPSILDHSGAHSSSPASDERSSGDRTGTEGDVSFSDSDHIHRYNSSSHDDDIMDSLKWY